MTLTRVVIRRRWRRVVIRLIQRRRSGRLIQRRRSGCGSVFLDLAVKFDFFFEIGNLVFLAPKLLCVLCVCHCVCVCVCV